MTEREKHGLKQQIKAQAEAMTTLEGGQLCQSIVDTCNAMLGVVGSVSVEQIDEMELQDLQAGYLSLAQMIVQFYQTMGNRGGAASGEQVHAGVLADLQAQQEKITRAQTQLEKDKQELEKLKADNASVQAEINKYEDERKQQEQIRESLTAMLKNCSSEVIQQQRAENDALLVTLNVSKSTLAELQEKEKELITESKKVTFEISQVEASIQGIPEENKRLLEEYEEKQELLDKLRKAEVDCSEEKQKELQDKIEELIPVVEKLESAYETLSNRLEDLEQQNTYYSSENQTLSTNVLEKVQAALRDLDKIVTEHKEILEAVKKQADTLSDNVKNCDEMRMEYADWFDVNETPLEAMIKRLEYSEEESQQLRESLNPISINQVKRLMKEVHVNLEQLDKIAANCVVAIRKDQKELLKKTRKQR